MDDPAAHRRRLARRLIPLVIEPNSLRRGQEVVIFLYDRAAGEAEIAYHGIFQRFQRGEAGLEIVLSQVPEEQHIVTDSLAHRNLPPRMTPDYSGLILPDEIVRERDFRRYNELLIIPINPRFLIADGQAYADANAEDNIARRTWFERP